MVYFNRVRFSWFYARFRLVSGKELILVFSEMYEMCNQLFYV